MLNKEKEKKKESDAILFWNETVSEMEEER